MMLASSAFGDCLMNMTVNFSASFIAYVEDDKYPACSKLQGLPVSGDGRVPRSCAAISMLWARCSSSNWVRGWKFLAAASPSLQLLARPALLGFRAAQAGCDWGQLFFFLLDISLLWASFLHCFLKRENSSSLGLQMSNACDAFRKCAFFHELQLIKLAIMRSMWSLMISWVNSFQSVQKSALN